MKNKKQFALNKLFNFCLVLGLLCAWCSINFFCDNDKAWGWGFFVASLIFIVPASIFTPFCYSFDTEGVSLCYIFLPTERYLWKDIYSIEVEVKSFDSSRASLFELFYAFVFSINGTNVGKKRFYMNGHIRKSFRTKYLLEKYWDGTITGYLLEDVKKWFSKRSKKKQTQIKTYLTDEVVALEKEAKAETSEWLKPFTAQAKQYDFDIKSKYLYVTNDFEDLNYRPNKGYTYTLVSEIARFNETDETRIVEVSVDLVYVRLGKSAYRGVKNKHLKEELESNFSDVLNEIMQNGIESLI